MTSQRRKTSTEPLTQVIFLRSDDEETKPPVDFQGCFDDVEMPQPPSALQINWETGEIREIVVEDPQPKSPARDLRQLMVLMERPFFALSKRRLSSAQYRSPDGAIEIRVEPGPAGMATIYDADLLTFLVDVVAQSGEIVEKEFVLRPATYFAAVGSKSGRDQYKLLGDAIGRLRTTRVTTNAGPDGRPGLMRTFCWLEGAMWQSGGWHLKLPDWLIEGAQSRFVLSICSEYFELSGFERFLYLTARKHVGLDNYKTFPIGISTLWKKSGSNSPLSRFRYEIKCLVMQNTLPGYYRLEWKELAGRDPQVVFSRSQLNMAVSVDAPFALGFASATESYTKSASEQLHYANELITLSTEHDFFYLLFDSASTMRSRAWSMWPSPAAVVAIHDKAMTYGSSAVRPAQAARRAGSLRG